MVKKFLKVSEVAEMLGITQKATRHRIARGELPHRRWGKRVLIPAQELDAFLQALPGCNAKEAAEATGDERRW
jgi:excisionase family DNA binding protein